MKTYKAQESVKKPLTALKKISYTWRRKLNLCYKSLLYGNTGYRKSTFYINRTIQLYVQQINSHIKKLSIWMFNDLPFYYTHTHPHTRTWYNSAISSMNIAPAGKYRVMALFFKFCQTWEVLHLRQSSIKLQCYFCWSAGNLSFYPIEWLCK